MWKKSKHIWIVAREPILRELQEVLSQSVLHYLIETSAQWQRWLNPQSGTTLPVRPCRALWKMIVVELPLRVQSYSSVGVTTKDREEGIMLSGQGI